MTRYLLAACLALALAFAQQAAAWHAIGHAAESQQQPGTPAEDCPQHSLFAAFADNAPAGAAAACDIASAPPRASAAAPQSASLPPRHSFDSRAPPAAPERR